MGRNMNCFTLSIFETMTMCSIGWLVSLCETSEPPHLVNTIDWLG